MNNQSDIEAIAGRAVACRQCFGSLSVLPGVIPLAQPRWIGPLYRSVRTRILIAALNPGQGRQDATHEQYVTILKEFASGQGSLSSVMAHQGEHMHRWGRGKFAKFYLEGLGLKMENIALANIAWCSTQGNIYPREMFEMCFKLHAGPLISALVPDVVLLSGASIHRLAGPIQKLVPKAVVVPMFHYAHREGKAAGELELSRVRKAIAGAAQPGAPSDALQVAHR